jgi:hypothetical protein
MADSIKKYLQKRGKYGGNIIYSHIKMEKMKSVETILRMGASEDKGECWGR